MNRLIDLETIQESINLFEDELPWLKFYYVVPQLTIQEIDEILDRKKRERIELESEVDAEFKAE
jgi:hypothetical protein